jgi:hypothetical protein
MSCSGVIIKNTVEMDFGRVYPRIQMIEIHTFIRKLFKDMNMSEEAIYGIMAVIQSQNQVVRMKFFDDREGDFKKFLEKYSGVGNTKVGKMNVKLKIYDASLSMKFVRIGDAPFEMTLMDITRALKPYGALMDIRRDRYIGTGYMAGFQGWVTAKMVISTDIPSYLQVGDHKLIVKYDGQKVTCRKCLKSGHLAKECPELNNDLYEEETGPERARELKEIEARKKREDKERKEMVIEEARKESSSKNDEKEKQPNDSPLTDEQETERSREDEARSEESSAMPAAGEENDEKDENEETKEDEGVDEVVMIEETPYTPNDDEDEEEDENGNEDEGMEGAQNILGSPGRTPKRKSYSDATRSSIGSESDLNDEDLMPPTPAAKASGNSTEKISQVTSPGTEESAFKNVKFTKMKGKKVRKSKF